jgi:hypothetical protein
MRTLVCRYCGREVPANRKLKHLTQYYCSEKACQAARKLSFERKKYKTNPSFRCKKHQSARDRKQKLANGGNPCFASQYQRSYRESHPDYVSGNRQKQRQRHGRKQDKTREQTEIVNPDTFMTQIPDNDTVYAMIAVDYKKIVNPDTLMSQIIDMKYITKDQTMFVRRL